MQATLGVSLRYCHKRYRQIGVLKGVQGRRLSNFYQREVPFDLDLGRVIGFKCGQRREAEGCHEKGSGPSKRAEVGIYGVCVRRVPFSLLRANNCRSIGKEVVEIGQVWAKSGKALNIRQGNLEFILSQKCLIAQISLRSIPCSPSTVPSETMSSSELLLPPQCRLRRTHVMPKLLPLVSYLPMIPLTFH